MDSKLINKEEWDSLVADPRFRKYRHYLGLWLEHIKNSWAEGQIVGELENSCAFGKAQLLKDQTDMSYEDIRAFFITAELIKEKEEDGNSDDSE